MSSSKREVSHEGEAEGKKPRNEEPYDSDDNELPEESVQDLLKWRTDDSFADWKIVIIVATTPPQNFSKNQDSSTDKKQFTNYNVRKCVLADGPRRSEYFVRLFENDGNFTEAQDKTSRIELNELQAKAFPELLDYLYSTGCPMMFSTDNATALYTLAKYFGVARLQNEVKKFCLEDMQKVKTCGTYYEHATILQEESILHSATKFCRDNIMNIDYNTSRLLYVPDPQFWLDLLKDHAEKVTISKLSAFIVGFTHIHSAVISMEIFKQLTDEKYLPESSYIPPSNALILLNTERRIVEKNGKQQEGIGDGELSNLQIRCVNIIARGSQNDLRDLNDEWFQNAFKKLSRSVIVEIIKRGFIPPPL